ncbi:hypothetical protein R69608_05091 [Paraburkholderia nemoris]|nr:hypothetical protein R69608_05091 [Paraburkholderia nemoris]
MSSAHEQEIDFRAVFGAIDDYALVTAAEFASLLAITETAFYQMRAKGRLPTPMIERNRHLRWRAGAVRQWLKDLQPEEAAPRGRGRPRKVAGATLASI